MHNVSNNALQGTPVLVLNVTSPVQRYSDIDLYDANNGFAVGGNYGPGPGSVPMGLKLNVTNNALVSTIGISSSGGSALKSLYAFKGNNAGKFFAVGEDKTFRIYNSGPSMITAVPAVPISNAVLAVNDDIHDVTFTDDFKGYFVADKSAFFEITVSNFLTGAVSFDQNSTAPTNPINPMPVNTNIHTISMIDDVVGYLGGMWYSGNISNPTILAKYNWKFFHEKGKSSTFFWYDRLGRMVISQNSKQFSKTPMAYSYTLYDALGRIIEVGEKAENSGNNNNFEKIFGAYVNGYLNTSCIDDMKMMTWINGNGQRREVTRTYYDQPQFTGGNCPLATGFSQENLRKRVASVTYETLFDGNNCTYDHATHYSYDIHGNVKSLIQDNKLLATPQNNPLAFQRFKRVDYEYDLISGKVNKVSYQNGEGDAFHHRYEYDADNRITEVQTSRNGNVWETDAKYFYYKHGPLARVEYGHDKVQGIDYAYTLQGWIKGLNSNVLDPAKDPGKDGAASIINNLPNPNSIFARDVSAYTLGYYQGDYSAINPSMNTNANNFEDQTAGSNLVGSRFDLFNGNIGHMVTTIVQPMNIIAAPGPGFAITPLVGANAYKYDQLNRIKEARYRDNINLAGNIWSQAAPLTNSEANRYRNDFTYDANGNILTQIKHGQTGVQFDNLAYNYELDGNNRLKKNRLYKVNDAILTQNLQPDDIENQPGTFNPQTLAGANYAYDQIGNLTADPSEEIANIEWTVYGKIKSITRTNGSSKKDLSFDYDAQGNRIAKHVLQGGILEKSTYYSRDAQGNVLAVYESGVICLSACETMNPVYGLSYKLKERHIHGSSRVGTDNHEFELLGWGYNNLVHERIVGNKDFEIGNHLGNVITVTTDRKIPVDADNNNVVEYFVPEISSANDYYAFGQQMPNRSFTSTNYRYGFNGKEKDVETNSGGTYDFGARMYDQRLGRWMSCDPLARKYPDQSPYDFAMNTPISAYDPDGKRVYFVAGAGNDQSGWNYTARFQGTWAAVFGWKNHGANDFKRINASNGKFGDMTFVDMARNNQYVGTRAGAFAVKDFQEVKKAVNDIVEDLHKNPLKEGEQLNLTGYSYGAVLQEHVAIALIEKGYKIDNLILIGSPTEQGSQLMGKLEELQKAGKIGQIIRHDIPGDKLSNPKNSAEYMEGAVQNATDAGPHFDLARPDNPDTKNVDEGADANKKIYDLGKDLKSKGVENKKD